MNFKLIYIYGILQIPFKSYKYPYDVVLFY